MTTPIWMALPPEVHSTLLSSGVGAGTLLAAADAWAALSSEYTTAAAELTTILGTVQAGAWEGQAAARYLAAHVPYLAWLMQAGANSASAAAQLQTAAGSYTAALAAMPTVAELAANRATLGMLVATNFFGINAIPIAVTEADYIRMWLQAASTMSIYQAVSAVTVASTPQTAPAPPVLEPGVGEAGSAAFTDPIEEWLSWSEHFSSMYRMLKQVLADPLGTLVQVITDFAADPAAAVATWMPLFYLFAYAATFAVLGTPIYAAIMGPAAASSAIPIALGLSGLANLAQVPAAEVPPVVTPQNLPAAVAVPTPPASALSSPPAPAPAPASTAPAPAAPVPNPPPATGAPPLYYAVAGGGPGVGFGPPMQQRAAEASRRPRSASEAAGAAAVAASGKKSRTRRRRGAGVKERGYRYEFLTADDEAPAAPHPEQQTRVSASGSVALGSTGAAARSGLADPAGLTTLAEDAFGNGATTPMMPGSWTTESTREEGNGSQHAAEGPG